jgi:hypothetical protein
MTHLCHKPVGGGGRDSAVQQSPEFPKDKWEYLKRGIMLHTDRSGLVHLEESDEDIEILEERAT